MVCVAKYANRSLVYSLPGRNITGGVELLWLCCLLLQVNVPGLLKPHPVLAQQMVSLLTSAFFRDVAWANVSFFGWSSLCWHFSRVLGALMPLHSQLRDPQLTGGPASGACISGTAL
jgi:hypothetical protein